MIFAMISVLQKSNEVARIVAKKTFFFATYATHVCVGGCHGSVIVPDIPKQSCTRKYTKDGRFREAHHVIPPPRPQVSFLNERFGPNLGASRRVLVHIDLRLLPGCSKSKIWQNRITPSKNPIQVSCCTFIFIKDGFLFLINFYYSPIHRIILQMCRNNFGKKGINQKYLIY